MCTVVTKHPQRHSEGTCGIRGDRKVPSVPRLHLRRSHGIPVRTGPGPWPPRRRVICHRFPSCRLGFQDSVGKRTSCTYLNPLPGTPISSKSEFLPPRRFPLHPNACCSITCKSREGSLAVIAQPPCQSAARVCGCVMSPSHVRTFECPVGDTQGWCP